MYSGLKQVNPKLFVTRYYNTNSLRWPYYENIIFLFFGIVCPTDFSCLNEGTCEDGSCSCPPGYDGLKCQTRKDLNMYSIHQTLPWRSPNRGLKRDVRINQTTFPVASRWIQTQRGVIAKWWSSLESRSWSRYWVLLSNSQCRMNRGGQATLF